jgi:hypothetical protein
MQVTYMQLDAANDFMRGVNLLKAQLLPVPAPLYWAGWVWEGGLRWERGDGTGSYGSGDLGCYVTARMPPLLGLLDKPTLTPANITLSWLGENKNLGQVVCHSNKQNFYVAKKSITAYSMQGRFNEKAADVRIKLQVARTAV